LKSSAIFNISSVAGHFQIEVGGDAIAQQANIEVLNVTTITAQVNGDAISASLFTNHGRRNNTWFGRAPGLTNSSNVVDVYVKTGWHEGSINIGDD
jgi:hypothetical protein